MSGFKFYTFFFNSADLILPIASVGLRPLGHTETQFIIVLHLNRLNGSFKSSSLCSVAVSLESAINLYACNKPEGPINLSGFHQKDGHDVVQHAHRIHS